jgi:hypothetical protein
VEVKASWHDLIWCAFTLILLYSGCGGVACAKDAPNP